MERPHLLSLDMAIDGMVVFMLCNVKRELYIVCCRKFESKFGLCLANIGVITDGSQSNEQNDKQSSAQQQVQQQAQQVEQSQPKKKPPINLFTERENQSEAANALPGPYGDAEIVLPDPETEDYMVRLSVVSYQPTEM